MSSRRLAMTLVAVMAASVSSCETSLPTSTEPVRPNAIVFGFVDEANSYGNVGAFIVQRPQDGQIFPICSGTLISPTVFLTAAHCARYYEVELAPLGFGAFVSFGNPISYGAQTDLRHAGLVPVLQVVTNPRYSQSQSDPGDIAVLIVRDRDTRGIAPAVLPTLGLLDQLAQQNALQTAVFTVVGYGVQDRVVGGGPPYFQDMNPIPRMYAYSAFSALNANVLRLSQNPATGNGGTCFGDSGGPNFLTVEGVRTLVAATVSGDLVCRSTTVSYRVDTSAARAFLRHFVTLP